MDNFLDKYLSLSNKNNILKITYGKQKSDNIFRRDLSESCINDIIKNTKSLNNKITHKSYNMEIYYKGNEKYIVANNELVYIINSIENMDIDNNMMFTRETINKDDYVIPSYSNYDNIENLEVLEISVVSCFNLYIMKDKDSGKKYVEIVISKPNSVSKISNFIKEIFKDK